MLPMITRRNGSKICRQERRQGHRHRTDRSTVRTRRGRGTQGEPGPLKEIRVNGSQNGRETQGKSRSQTDLLPSVPHVLRASEECKSSDGSGKSVDDLLGVWIRAQVS